MPYDVSGNFTRLYNWQADAAASVKILATRMDGEFDNYAEALNQAFLRSGVAPMLGDLSLGGFEIKLLGDGDSVTPALRFATDGSTGMYMPAGGTLAFSAGGTQFLRGINGGATITGTLAISGATTVGGSLIVGERLVGTSPNSGTTGGLIVRDASGNPNAAYLQFTNFARDAQYGVVRGLVEGGLTFYDDTTERARINTDGQLLVGVTAPFDTLTDATVQILGVSEAALALKAVGTTNTIAAFHNDSGSGRVGWISTDGTTAAFNSVSDRRWKDNIRLAGDSGDIIDAVQIVSHGWLFPGMEDEPFAAIAQDLHKVYPTMVSVGGDTKPWGIDPRKGVFLLWRELQLVRKRLAALEA